MSMVSHTLAAHLETTEPHIQPRQPTQTEQFVDAPPKDMYKNNWRKHATKRQEKKK